MQLHLLYLVQTLSLVTMQHVNQKCSLIQHQTNGLTETPHVVLSGSLQLVLCEELGHEKVQELWHTKHL